MLYAGIGSRETPPKVCARMSAAAEALRELGFTLRSGASGRADEAFEKGAGGQKEIYIPWSGFNGRSPSEPGVMLSNSVASENMASRYHPAWGKLTRGAKALLARNCHVILGENLDAPVNFVLFWSPSLSRTGNDVSNASGGTGMAVRLAWDHRIPCYFIDATSPFDGRLLIQIKRALAAKKS